MDMFESAYDKPSLPKHIRLIELFAGIGAQAKALEELGADFESWDVVEWSPFSIIAYNAIHNKDDKDYSSGMTYDEVVKNLNGISADYNKPMTEKEIRHRGEPWARKVFSSMTANFDMKPNVCDVHSDDLGIVDKKDNTYVLTYSFPCTDLSNAGKMAGMEKGSGTRSGTLWEVERILNECKEGDCLPQVLVMENVPNVRGKKNVKPWNEWLDALQKLGYTNYVKTINAKDYGIPQNRKRCFMVSILGEYSFSFPKKETLRYRLRDYIKNKVDEKYYLSDELVKSFKECRTKESDGPVLAGSLDKYHFRQADAVYSPDGISPSIMAHLGGQNGHQIQILEEPEECVMEGSIRHKGYNDMTGRVYSPSGLAPSIRTFSGGNTEVKIAVEGPPETICLNSKVNGKQPSLNDRIYSDKGVSVAVTTTPFFMGNVLHNRRIRKLTEGECYRLMGFEERDYESCVMAGQSSSTRYHQAGDSIVVTILIGIFGELLGLDYSKTIREYSAKLAEECKQ